MAFSKVQLYWINGLNRLMIGMME